MKANEFADVLAKTPLEKASMRALAELAGKGQVTDVARAITEIGKVAAGRMVAVKDKDTAEALAMLLGALGAQISKEFISEQLYKRFWQR